MTRADVFLNPMAIAGASAQSGHIVSTPTGVLYSFQYWSNDNGLYWSKSTDEGFTWTEPVQIRALGSASSFSVWYDKWTPGDAGTKIHLAYFESTGDDVFYRALDTGDDSLGTEAAVFAGASSGPAANTCISITKAIGGNLYVAFDIDGGTEVGFYGSTDAGASFGALLDVNEIPSTDYYLLVPGFAADTNDIMAIYWDRSASEISRKNYDASLNLWLETSIATGMTSISNQTASPQFSVAVDDLNNKVILVAWTNRDTANADLRCWSIDDAGITEVTNVVLNSTDDQQMCVVAVRTDVAEWYVFYGGKSDGSETVGTSINIYYKVSSDGGTTWGAETQLSVSPRNFQGLWTHPVFSGDFHAAFLANYTLAADSMYLSALLPAAGGITAPILAGGVVA